ncbi:CatB-related O-acetyltransferase [Clostridium felsineum]|uniref:CatB-related O-acetyltransferase n=1 Tax=Clostridium felsineum TaxID=36839 RepID=UPI00214D912F|nr:CatB-related O-acetyltransferase [Clostridium felsineum]MCR3760247.1 CatB-related O-acetyltransferase [Clostridium felsineum]
MIKVSPKASIRTFVFQNGDKKDFPLFTIGKNSYINDMNIQVSTGNEIINIHIGNYTSIAYNVTLLIDRNHDYKSISTCPMLEVRRKLHRKGQIIIGHDVWIGNNVTILSGVRIGNGVVVGAGTLVTKDVEPYAIVVGNPMRMIKYRFHNKEIQKLQSIRWWNWDKSKIDNNIKWFGEEIEAFIDEFYEDINICTDKRNSKDILFIWDFNYKYSIWKKVLKEYLNVFSKEDDIKLVIKIKKEDELNIGEIHKLIGRKKDAAEILVTKEADEKSLFKDANYFITTRSPNTMKYIDWADEFNVKLLSGVDFPIFKKQTIINYL